jgi:hypothetical protein
LRNPADPLDFQNRRVSILVRFQDNTKHVPLDLDKLQGDISKTPKNSGVSALPGTSAPEVHKSGAPPRTAVPTVKTPFPPGGRDDAELPPHSQSTGPEAVVSSEPKTATLSPAPAAKSTLPTPVRLDDQVRDEVRQMLQDEGVADPPSGDSADPNKEPRVRLGW